MYWKIEFDIKKEKWKENKSINREFHALPVSKKHFVSRVDRHLKNLLLVRTANKNGKDEIISYKFTLNTMFYTSLKRAFKTKQTIVFESQISLVFHIHLSEIMF